MGRRPDRPVPRPGLVRSAAAALVGNPTATTGGLVMTAMAAAILTNALTLQPGRHPAPLFVGTRPVAAEDQPLAGTAGDPADALDDLVARTTGRQSGVDRALVADVQLELKTRGYYSGDVDGVPGPMTSAAILAFQKAAGLEPTGEVGADLLDALKDGTSPRSSAEPAPLPAAPPETETAAAPPAAIPLPVPAPRRPAEAPAAPPAAVAVADTPKPVKVQPVSVSPEEITAVSPPSRAAPPPPRPAEAPAPRKPAAEAPAPVPAKPVAATPDAAPGDPRVAKIQEALDLLGFGPLKADGVMTTQTRDAIRRFEENRGLPVTGAINKAFLTELIKIGGLR